MVGTNGLGNIQQPSQVGANGKQPSAEGVRPDAAKAILQKLGETQIAARPGMCSGNTCGFKGLFG